MKLCKTFKLYIIGEAKQYFITLAIRKMWYYNKKIRTNKKITYSVTTFQFHWNLLYIISFKIIFRCFFFCWTCFKPKYFLLKTNIEAEFLVNAFVSIIKSINNLMPIIRLILNKQDKKKIEMICRIHVINAV